MGFDWDLWGFSKCTIIWFISGVPLRIQQRLIFVIVIRCSRLQLWVGINWLRISRLLSEGMSNIYIWKLLLRKTDVLKTLIFGELQLMQISLNFKLFCNLRSGSKTVCVFSIFLNFERNYDVLKWGVHAFC